jgi:hypothetical protein
MHRDFLITLYKLDRTSAEVVWWEGYRKVVVGFQAWGRDFSLLHAVK